MASGIAKVFCVQTNFDVSKYSITWTLTKIKFSTDLVTSPVFTFDKEAVDSCYITLWFDLDKVAITFMKTSVHNVSAEIAMNLELNNELMLTKTKMLHFLDGEKMYCAQFFNYECGWMRECRRDLNCIIKVNFDITIAKENSALHISISGSDFAFKLPNDLQSLMSDETHSDVTIHVGTKKFQLHKCILSARSPVFSAMFAHNMTENNLNEVRITDIQPDIMSNVFQYIYSGLEKVDFGSQDMPDSGVVKSYSFKTAHDLYLAADKYDLNELKCECRMLLVRSMSPENASDLKKLAQMCNDKELKRALPTD